MYITWYVAQVPAICVFRLITIFLCTHYSMILQAWCRAPRGSWGSSLSNCLQFLPKHLIYSSSLWIYVHFLTKRLNLALAERGPGNLSLSLSLISISMPPRLLLTIIQCTAHITRHGIAARIALRLIRHWAPLEQHVRFLTGWELDVVRPLMIPVARAENSMLRRRWENWRHGVRDGKWLRWHGDVHRVWFWWRLVCVEGSAQFDLFFEERWST